MKREYKITGKENFPAFAKKLGYHDFREVWDHKSNKKLRNLRKDCKTLEKNDVIKLPTPKSIEKELKLLIGWLNVKKSQLLILKVELERQIAHFKQQNYNFIK